MIPLRDNIQPRTTPFVNYAIIGICSFVFFQQLSQKPGQPSLIEQYGMIPARVTSPNVEIRIEESRRIETAFGPQVQTTERVLARSAVPPWATLLTCIFLHGGWMHFLGNMWFLWIFGDNVEDRYGHLVYLVFYLFCGVAASAAHFAAAQTSTVPTIGASGAIAGVMGAYMILYPRARVLTLVPLIIILQVLSLPAPVFLGIWFLIQFYQGALAATSAAATGVAWWAHIGGFAVGFIVTRLLGKRHKLRPRVDHVRPGSERIVYYTGSPYRRARRL